MVGGEKSSNIFYSFLKKIFKNEKGDLIEKTLVQKKRWYFEFPQKIIFNEKTVEDTTNKTSDFDIEKDLINNMSKISKKSRVYIKN